jgi:RHH-type proline utilization regulon transcriptional repressor/proline dehydrogenase/delta 1-pyrroline-5-carboxylate dehydrogenase
MFSLAVGDAAWDKQIKLFLDAIHKMENVSDAPRRSQNRLTETIKFDPDEPFSNVANTDFSLKHNQRWIQAICANWRERTFDPIPLQINGEFIHSELQGEGVDPSRPGQTLYKYALATPDHIEFALATAVEAQAGWSGVPVSERKSLLVRCAERLAAGRGDLIGVMMRDASKTVAEADPEVSEAIDFANYYARGFEILGDTSQLEYSPLGTVLVTPPWNFPLAIPAGGTLAALIGGNTVLLKPAPEVVLVAWTFVNLLWDAGIPKTALQFVPTTDDEVGKRLVTDDRVDGVILTGAYDTARLFLSWKHTMNLLEKLVARTH